jgi:hypothetical protein
VPRAEEGAGVTYEVKVTCELWTVNAERSAHWRKHRAKTVAARWAAKIAAMEAKIPTMTGRVHIQAEPLQGRRGPAGDPGAYAPPVKAAIDGLRDAGVLVDDTDRYVSAIEHLPSRRVDARDVGLILYLTPAAPTS